MKKTMTLMSAALIAALPLTAHAHKPGSDAHRGAKQQERIEQGVKSGALTKHEAARLQREQMALNKMQAHAMHDGKLTKAEKVQLHRAHNRASEHIYREKHDLQKRR